MFSLLLAIIYLSFISLGLPDSLLGSAWPTMYPQLGVPVSYSGIVFMIISVGTIISSLQSDRLTRRLGTGEGHGVQCRADCHGTVRLLRQPYVLTTVPPGDPLWARRRKRGCVAQ